jgi:hypothetical protein
MYCETRKAQMRLHWRSLQIESVENGKQQEQHGNKQSRQNTAANIIFCGGYYWLARSCSGGL